MVSMKNTIVMALQKQKGHESKVNCSTVEGTGLILCKKTKGMSNCPHTELEVASTFTHAVCYIYALYVVLSDAVFAINLFIVLPVKLAFHLIKN